MAKRQALGRGLSALLDNAAPPMELSKPAPSNNTIGHVAGPVAMLEINQIEANPFQPRTKFNEEALVGLAKSIETYGIIQPITVRKIGARKFQLISGERRFRASQLAELEEIPAYVRSADDDVMLEMALVENIQRENLDPIEVAISYKRLIEECELTQEALSKRVGKSRSAVTNSLRLLKLPAEIQVGLIEKSISMGHARALISAGSEAVQLNLFRKILNQGFSVRQVEELVKRDGSYPKKTAPRSQSLSFEEQKVQADLRLKLGKSVSIKKQESGSGKIEIKFSDPDEFQRIVDLLDI
ncbi:MAG: ParB/RepB/Spo0J family partition protein [Flavobacteriales bacterium]|nr:ParB/RepB/Spo0J family partition protein [Flavobacteriales bacterium]